MTVDGTQQQLIARLGRYKLHTELRRVAGHQVNEWGLIAMTDILVAFMLVLVLAAVTNFGLPSQFSPGCKPGTSWSIQIC